MENIVTEKRCVKCGEIKSIDDFHEQLITLRELYENPMCRSRN